MPYELGGTRLDAPSLRVRALNLKRGAGQPLKDKEWNRLAGRMSAEEGTAATPGGSVSQPLPREASSADAYAAGRNQARGLFQPPQAKPATVQTGRMGAPVALTRTPQGTPGAIVGTAASPSPNPTEPLPAPSATIAGRSFPATAAEAADPTPIVQPRSIQKLAQPATPVASPTTQAAPQTESKNPLTGDGNAQPAGTTSAVVPAAQTLGFTQRGSRTPAGQDADDGLTGGSGLYARKFTNKGAADIYTNYTKRLFSAATGAT